MQFFTIVTVKEFSKSLYESFKEKLPTHQYKTLSVSYADRKKETEALVVSNVTMSYISVSLLGDEELQMVEEVNTEEFHGGIAYKLILLLLEKY